MSKITFYKDFYDGLCDLYVYYMYGTIKVRHLEELK